MRIISIKLHFFVRKALSKMRTYISRHELISHHTLPCIKKSQIFPNRPSKINHEKVTPQSSFFPQKDDCWRQSFFWETGCPSMTADLYTPCKNHWQRKTDSMKRFLKITFQVSHKTLTCCTHDWRSYCTCYSQFDDGLWLLLQMNFWGWTNADHEKCWRSL